jgi:hypothetical protein
MKFGYKYIACMTEVGIEFWRLCGVVWGCWGRQGQGLQSESTLCHLSLIKSMGIISFGKVVKRSRMQQLMMDMKVVWINIRFLGAHTSDFRSKFVLELPNSRPLKLQL